jgi:hypothetical protein
LFPKSHSYHVYGAVNFLPKGSVTFEPEPTQHSTQTFVWAYIARHVWLLFIRRVCPDL